MMSEIDLYGVFVPQLLVCALIAAAVTSFLRRGLAMAHFYRLVWHPALFDLALFVVVTGAVFLLFNHGAGRALPVLDIFAAYSSS